MLGGAEAPPNFFPFVFEGYTVDREIFTLKMIRVKSFHGVKCSRFVRSATVTSAWCVLSVESTTRYRERQISLAVTLWLSRVVVDWTFTSVGVDVRARLFVD